MTHRPEDTRPLRILSLDGGGVRGLSELVILDDIMRQVKKELNLDKIPKPCDYFDLIGGTSTGGIIAVLLGRLRLSVEECLERYNTLSSQIFAKELLGSPIWQSRYDHVKLEMILKRSLVELEFSEEELMKDTRPQICHTFVTTTPKPNVQMNNPVCFRTYVTRGRPDEEPVKIWEALRATSAAPTYFDSITIHGVEYVDGGFGCNNPSRVVYDEAKKIWPGREIGCIISIGTGMPKVQSVPNMDLSYWLQSFWVLPLGDWFHVMKLVLIGWMDILQRVATNCDLVHQEMLRDLDWRNNYFRFNIQQGAQNIPLAAWKKLPDLVIHTEQYLLDAEVKRQKQKVAEKLTADHEPPRPVLAQQRVGLRSFPGLNL